MPSPHTSRRAVLTALGLSAAAVAIGSVPASGRPSAKPTSPAVHRDRRVTFTFTDKSANSVGVMGSWQTALPPAAQPLARKGKGVWTLTIGPLKPNFYTYNFVVDGRRTRDPVNRNGSRPNSTITTFLVPGAGAEFLTEHDVPHGALQVLTYRSAVTRADRNATVWTPPGYSRSRGPYPTLYLAHGGGDTYQDWVLQGRADVILDNLFAAGQLAPMVVVMPDGNVRGATGMPQFDAFPAEILDNLTPAVERAYQVGPQRALAGLSLGGLQTWNLLLARPGAMAYIGDFSAGYAPMILDALASDHPELLSDPRLNAQTRLHRIYCGNSTDVVYQDNIRTRALFDRFGIHYEFSQYPDSGHTWETWRVNLHDFAPRLFR